MHINLYFGQLASRRGVQGAIFIPKSQGARNYSQFLSFEFLEYLIKPKEFDRTKEEKLTRLENEFHLSSYEIKEALERDKARKCKDKRLHYIGLKAVDSQSMAIFRTADMQTKVFLTQADVRRMAEKPDGCLREGGYSISEHQLAEAIGHFKNTAPIVNQSHSP